MPQVHVATVDVAAHEVGIPLLQLRRTGRTLGEYTLPEAGGEPLDLPLDPIRHVHRRSVRHMAVRPAGVMARRCARVIEVALLRDEDERRLSDLS